MPIDSPRPRRSARPAPGVARWLIASAGVIVLAGAAHAERLAAQAPFTFPFPDTVRALHESSVAASRAPTSLAPAGCLSLRVIPGDTAGRTMPRMAGDSLVDPRMPRGDGFRPSCDALRTAEPTVARLFRMPDGSYRALPKPHVNVPPRP